MLLSSLCWPPKKAPAARNFVRRSIVMRADRYCVDVYSVKVKVSMVRFNSVIEP